MVPYLLIIAFAGVGALVWGGVGFVSGGLIGFASVFIIGMLLNMFSGGVLPSKVRDETATDFIVKNPELIQQAFPELEPYATKTAVAELLDSMYKRSTVNNPSINLDNAGNPEVFLASAMEVAEEMPTEELKSLARELVGFVSNHRLWYG